MSCQIWHSLLELLNLQAKVSPVFERDKNNRRVLARRSYNLYSDVQKGENVVVEIPVQAGEKKFKYEQKVKTCQSEVIRQRLRQSGIWDIPIMC